MPWIALDTEDKKVIPEDVPDHTTVHCPACDGQMSPRGPTKDGKARHFVHHSRQQEKRCGGGGEGESDQHRKMKSMALSGLRQWFEPMLEDSSPEADLDVSRTGSDASTRRADVLVEFGSDHPLFGDALAVEVQYRNHAKEIETVTHDYVTIGVSVFWAREENFEDDHFRMHDLTLEFQSGNQWTAVAAPARSPLEFDPVVADEQSKDFTADSKSVEKDSEWNGFIHIDDPVFDIPGLPNQEKEDGHPIPHLPDCKHNFSVVRKEDEREFQCLKCDLVLRRVDERIQTDSLGPEHRTIVVAAPTKSRFRSRNIRANPQPDRSPYCTERVWKIDQDADRIMCVGCGREYPRNNDDLREKYERDISNENITEFE
jgi:hypothetical protein